MNRRRMQEDLESREKNAKRTKTDVDDAEEAFRRQMVKLQEEGARLRRKREEALRAAAKDAEDEGEDGEETPVATGASRFSELDRTLRVRWKRHGNEGLTAEELGTLFSRFGRVQDVVVPPPSVPKAGEKEKKLKTALVVFENIVSAHAAVHDALGRGGDAFRVFKDIAWASGKEPDISHGDVSKPESSSSSKPQSSSSSKSKPPPPLSSSSSSSKPTTGWTPPPPTQPKGKAPSFSFSTSKTLPVAQSTDYESITLMRMRAAEKARIEAEIRKQDEEEGDRSV